MAQTADEPINWKLIATAPFSHQDLGVEKLILCFLVHQQISDGDAVSLCNFVDVHTIDAYLPSLGLVSMKVIDKQPYSRNFISAMASTN